VILQAQTRVDGYILQKPIGKGRFSTVWLATQESTGFEVAIKFNEISNDPVQLKRFKREAQLLQDLNHPNIVPFRSYDVYEDTFFIVMRYIRGTNLETLIADHRRSNAPNSPIMSIPEIISILRPLASALDYIHDRGLIHRDLKPANILREEGTNNVLITDFGLAKSTHDLTKTTTGIDFTGTLLYTSP
jgi:serine/threonine protein kinase